MDALVAELPAAAQELTERGANLLVVDAANRTLPCYRHLGEPYFPFDGQELSLPPNPRERPGRELLEWCGDVVFRG